MILDDSEKEDEGEGDGVGKIEEAVINEDDILK